MIRIGVIIGFIFIIFGLVWSFLNGFFCTNVCEACSFQELSPCFFLFLFVGIIFIVSGASLIVSSFQLIKVKEKKSSKKKK